MTSPTEEFISSFHSLTGTALGERRKNLFLLLNKTRQSLQASDAELDLSSLHPKTPLEETFKVDALIFFRRIPELVDVLKSENPVLIKKVLRVSSWVFNNVNEDIVTTVFPFVSYNVKVKIVNRLAWCLCDQRKADVLFEGLREKYGLYLASKLLPACSSELILKIFKTCGRVRVSSRAMLIIIKKYSELSSEIFEALKSHSSGNTIGILYKGVFVYLAKSNNPSFLSLYTEYDPSIQIGWRATNKFIHANKESVINKANTFCMLLHKKQSFKSLSQDFGSFYVRLFPPSMNDFYNSFAFLFSFIRKVASNEEKLMLIEETFRKVYGSELLQHPKCVTLTLLDLLPLEKRRGVTYKPLYISEDRWSCYLEIDQSIPLLKKRISLSSDFKTRSDLIRNLVETCRINGDKKAVGEVCKYVVNQHRNDNVLVRQTFLSVLKQSFELEKLDEEHWGCINELMEIFDMNKEVFSLATNFLIAYIHHRLLKGYDIKESLSKYLKLQNTKLNLFNRWPVFEKRCLLLTGELLPQIFDGCTLKLPYIDFLNSLVNWNKRHPEDEISLFGYPAAMESFREVLTTYKSADCTQNIIEYLLRHRDENYPDELLSLCLSKIDLHIINRRILNWLMQYKPLIVVNNIEIIIDLLLKYRNRCFWRQARNFSHLQLPQTLGPNCLDRLTINISNYRADLIRHNAIVGLSYLMNPDKFLEFSFDYYPSKERAESQSDEERRHYKLQKSVASSLKNIIPPSLALESILNFCKGDYLKLIQSSLYSVSGNVNEDKLPLFFGELSERAVSVRKHTVHLTLRVLDRTLIYSLFRKFMEMENNSSIRQFLVKGSFNLFIQDPSEVLWELLKSNVGKVDVDDKEVVQILTEMDKIPSEYLLQYVLFLWEYLENLSDSLNDGYNQAQKFSLLRSLPATTVQVLPKEFALTIIRKYFLHFDDQHKLIVNLNSFVCKFLIYCQSEIEQEQRMNLVFDALKRCMCYVQRRTTVDQFLREFCDEFLYKRSLSKHTLFMFVTLWNNTVKPEKAFDQYVYLQLTLIYLETVNHGWSLSEAGERLAKFCNSLSDAYGTAVVGVLCDVLRTFVSRYYLGGAGVVEEGNRYLLIEGLMKASLSSACVIAAISLLKRCPSYSATQTKHDEIVRVLNDIEDPVVQIHLNHHLYRM